MTDAARAVIGSILWGGRALEDVADLIAPADFADARHEAIMEAAQRVAARGKRVDVITVSEELPPADLERVGGSEELHLLAGSVPTPESAAYYAEIVAKDAARRRMAGLAIWLQQAVEDGADPLGLQEEVRTRLDAIPTPGESELPVFATSIQDSLDQLEKGHTGYLPTGWPDLDALIHGWRPGSLHVVGARPGQGKSIIGAQTSLVAAQHGKAAVIASMEMTAHELNLRLIAQTASIGMDSLVKHRLSEMEWQQVANALPNLLDAAMFIDDNPGQTVARIRAHARRVAQRAELGLIVVDYLQQIEVPTHLRKAPRHEQVAHTARSLKLLARELNVPVIALAQVNRGPENRADKRPSMSDLRESGAIEADADVVLLLHHETEDDPELEVLVRKNRWGRKADFKLLWHAHFARLASHSDPYGRQAS